MKKISHKLTALLAGCFLGLAASGVLSLHFLGRTADGIREAESKARIDSDLYRAIVQTKDVLADVLPPPAYVIESYLVVLQLTEATTTADRNRLTERLNILHREFDKSQQHWKKDLPEGKLKEAVAASGEPALRFYEIVDRQLLPAVAAGDLARAKALAGTLLLAQYDRQRSAVDAVVTQASQESTTQTRALQDLLTISEQRVAAEIRSATQLTIMGIILITMAVGALGMAFSVAISRSLTRTTTSLSLGAGEVLSAAQQVSAAGQTLAEGSSEQAASLEETSASLEEMAGMTKRNAENATKANQLAREARQAADAGSAEMQAMAGAMGEIKRSSDDIAKIVRTIDEIAFQTNILALNAAVEAARAGEVGMGFAVVAEEVRNLAQRSAHAAKDTATKIESAIAKTAHGVDISSKVEANLVEIIDKIRGVDALVTEVATASREQSQGVDQINTAVREMDRVVQSNAAAAEESASAGEELSAQAAAMQGAVGELHQLAGRKSVSGFSAAGAPGLGSLHSAVGGRTRGNRGLAAPEKPAHRAFADVTN